MKHSDIITKNFFTRHTKLCEKWDETAQKLPVLNAVLSLSNDKCWALFEHGNRTLEELEYLYSMLVNCFLDDATMVVHVKELSKGIPNFKFGWGSDDEQGVGEGVILEAISISTKQEEFHKAHKEDIDGDSPDRGILREYFEFSNQLRELFLKHSSDKTKQKLKEIESRSPFNR
jgi:hypothetical protein